MTREELEAIRDRVYIRAGTTQFDLATYAARNDRYLLLDYVDRLREIVSAADALIDTMSERIPNFEEYRAARAKVE